MNLLETAKFAVSLPFSAFIIHNPQKAKIEQASQPLPRAYHMGADRTYYPNDTSLSVRINGRDLLKIEDGKAIDELTDVPRTRVVFRGKVTILDHANENTVLDDTGIEVIFTAKTISGCFTRA